MSAKVVESWWQRRLLLRDKDVNLRRKEHFELAEPAELLGKFDGAHEHPSFLPNPLIEWIYLACHNEVRMTEWIRDSN